MNSGFWLSAVILVSGVAVAGLMLPNKARTSQVERVKDTRSQELAAID
jgi:hypothetical protein